MKLVVEIEMTEDQIEDCRDGDGSWDNAGIEFYLIHNRKQVQVMKKTFQCNGCKTMWYNHQEAFICCSI